MKIYRIIELTEGKVTRLHDKFYLSSGTLTAAVDHLVDEYTKQGMTVGERLHCPLTRIVYLECEGFAKLRILKRLYKLDKYGDKMSRKIIGVLDYDAW